SGGVTATVAALSKLIEGGDPNIRRDAWVPHRPARPEKSEGGIRLKMVSDYEPAGDQPTAIADLVAGVQGWLPSVAGQTSEASASPRTDGGADAPAEMQIQP